MTAMTETTTGHTPREVMDRLLADHFAAEAQHDVPGILDTLAEDCEHDVVGWPTGPSHGHEDLQPFYHRLFADLQGSGIEPLRRYYGADFCVDEVQWSGIATGQPFGLDGRNRPVSFRLLHVCEFADGKISRENVWVDTATLFAQLAD